MPFSQMLRSMQLIDIHDCIYIFISETYYITKNQPEVVGELKPAVAPKTSVAAGVEPEIFLEQQAETKT